MPRPKSDIEPRILHAARARFLYEGVDGASLRAIARDAKTSIGMVYYYFPSKDDLFLAVVEEVYVGLLADLTEALSADVPVADRIRRVYERIGALTDDEVTVVSLIVREAIVSSERLSRLTERFQRGHLPLVVATVAEGQRDGTFDPALPLPVVALVTGLMGIVPSLLARVAERVPPLAGLPRGSALTDTLHALLLRAVGASPPPGG